MRVPADHFFRHHAGDGGKVEQTTLLRHARLINDLEQQIAQFIGEGTPVLPLDGIQHLVGFLDRVGGYGLECLFPVPGAATHRVAQPRHKRQQSCKLPPGFIHRARLLIHRSSSGPAIVRTGLRCRHGC